MFIIPPFVLSIDLLTTSPFASTLKPVIVIVPIVKSPEPSILVMLDNAPLLKLAMLSVIVPPPICPKALIVLT